MWKRFALGSTIVIVLTASATATAGLLEVKSVTDALNVNKAPKLGHDLAKSKPDGPQTILLLGSDQRGGKSKGVEVPHSDSMMLMRIDPGQSATTVLSIPRDLKVTFPFHGAPHTAKINEAFTDGGIRLTLQTVKRTLHIPINHVIDLNLRGFKKMTDALGCVYVDIDRHYLNTRGGPGGYAVIDVPAGYQRMCGEKALDYVRYRHADTDIVRGARQQAFLREARQQLDPSQLVDKRHKLEKIFGKYSKTDIHSDAAVLELIKQVLFSAGHPVRTIRFKANLGPSYVTASAAQISAATREFLHGGAAAAARRPASGRRRGRVKLQTATSTDLAVGRRMRAPFPVYFPKRRVQSGAKADDGRSYTIADQKGHTHRAYRIVVNKGTIGDYYGVQGMDWTNPPILKHPQGNANIGGKQCKLFYDGKHLQLVSWQEGKAVYWLSNTLTNALSNKQMMAIVRAAKPVR